MKRSWLLAGCLLAWLTPASASPPAETFTHASLIAETRSVQPGKPLSVALRLESKEGWHTYWRYPGDTGLATKLDWTLPDGFRAGDVRWPFPERIEIGPTANFGYHGEVLLLSTIEVPTSATGAKTVMLNAKANWLSCSKICVPESASLTLTLPVQGTAPQKDLRWDMKFNAARAQIPAAAPWPVIFSVHKNELALSLPAKAAAEAHSVLFFPHDYGAIDNAAPQTFGLHQGRAVLKMTPGTMITDKTDRLSGTIVMVFKNGEASVSKAYEITASRNDRTL